MITVISSVIIINNLCSINNMCFESINNQYSPDIIICLKDNNCEIELPCHKSILCTHSKLFNAMLTGSFKEESMERIELIVPNASATYNIIMTFYESKSHNWQYQMEKFKAAIYLQSNTDQTFLKDLVVPEEEFETFLTYINLFEATSFVIECVLDKLPLNYYSSDSSDSFNEIISVMIKNLPTNLMVLLGNKKIQYIDSKTGIITNERKFPRLPNNCYLTNVSNENIIKYLSSVQAFLIFEDTFQLIDLASGKITKTFQSSEKYYLEMIISSNNDYLITFDYDANLKIYDILQNELIYDLKMTRRDHIYNGIDNKFIIITHGDYKYQSSITIWDPKFGKMERELLTVPGNKCNLFVTSNRSIYFTDRQLPDLPPEMIPYLLDYHVYDYDSGIFIREIKSKFYEYVDLFYVYNENSNLLSVLHKSTPWMKMGNYVISIDSTIIVYDDQQMIHIWNLLTNKEINTIPHNDSMVIHTIHISPNNQYIYGIILSATGYHLCTWNINSRELINQIHIDDNFKNSNFGNGRILYTNPNLQSISLLESFSD